MRTLVLVNPAAAGGRVGRRWPQLQADVAARYDPVRTVQTTHAADAHAVVQRGLADGIERIVVVGGDGTLHSVANALFDAEGQPLAPDVVLAPFPAGTGSDFVRSLRGLARTDTSSSSDAVRQIDVGRLTTHDPDDKPRHRVFLNIASVGVTGRVVERVTHTTKVLGGRAAFFLGALRGLAAHRRQRIRLRLDDQPVIERRLHTVVVANGRFFGGGMQIAPNARLDDGAFEVVVLDEVPLAQFVRLSRRLYRGDLPELSWLHRYRARHVHIEGLDVPAAWPAEADGEQTGHLPVHAILLPRALRVQLPTG